MKTIGSRGSRGLFLFLTLWSGVGVAGEGSGAGPTSPMNAYCQRVGSYLALRELSGQTEGFIELCNVGDAVIDVSSLFMSFYGHEVTKAVRAFRHSPSSMTSEELCNTAYGRVGRFQQWNGSTFFGEKYELCSFQDSSSIELKTLEGGVGAPRNSRLIQALTSNREIDSTNLDSNLPSPALLQDLSSKGANSISGLVQSANLYMIEGNQQTSGDCKGRFKLTYRYVNLDAKKSGWVIFTPSGNSCAMVEERKGLDEEPGGMGFLFFNTQDIIVSLGDALKTVNFYFSSFQWGGTFYLYQELAPVFEHPYYMVKGTMSGNPAGFMVYTTNGDIILPPQ